jgi:hypothetical protein
VRKPRLSNNERERLLKLADKKSALFKRKKGLYNRLYRKSILFIGSWVIRLLFVGMFVAAALMFNTTKSTGIEKVRDTKIDVVHIESGHGTIEKTTLLLKTDKEDYTVDFTGYVLPELNTNDNVTIERNYFGKAIYFTNPGWNWKYTIDHNFYFYFVVLAFTLISFFFNDGLDRFTTKTLLITSLIDILTLLLFLIF